MDTKEKGIKIAEERSSHHIMYEDMTDAQEYTNITELLLCDICKQPYSFMQRTF